MNKTLRRIVVICALLAFSLTAVAIAEDFYVVKDAAGKVSVVDKKPADEKSVVKGPFKTKGEAESAAKAPAAAKTPVNTPDGGC
jgi:hypothetical protein